MFGWIITQEATDEGNPVERFPPMRAATEDDDLARAVTLSIKVGF